LSRRSRMPVRTTVCRPLPTLAIRATNSRIALVSCRRCENRLNYRLALQANSAGDPEETLSTDTVKARSSAIADVGDQSHQQPHCAGKLPSTRESP
jgi:hypothetical protein